jgi:hypothetical protein
MEIHIVLRGHILKETQCAPPRSFWFLFETGKCARKPCRLEPKKNFERDQCSLGSAAHFVFVRNWDNVSEN